MRRAFLTFDPAVSRASLNVVRHHGHIVRLEYKNSADMVAFTTEELKKFNGFDPSRPLLMAVKGKVYDVTKGSAFYGTGGRYNIYAGRDAARGLAVMSLEPEVVNNPTLEGVSAEDLETLAEWISKLEAKYSVVGYVSDGLYSAEAKASVEQSGGAACDALFFAGKVRALAYQGLSSQLIIANRVLHMILAAQTSKQMAAWQECAGISAAPQVSLDLF